MTPARARAGAARAVQFEAAAAAELNSSAAARRVAGGRR